MLQVSAISERYFGCFRFHIHGSLYLMLNVKHHSFKTLKNNSGHYDFNGKEPMKSFLMYQDMQSEVPSQESLLESLETRAESLYSSASEERTAELRDLHCSMEERWCSLSTNIPLR